MLENQNHSDYLESDESVLANIEEQLHNESDSLFIPVTNTYDEATEDHNDYEAQADSYTQKDEVSDTENTDDPYSQLSEKEKALEAELLETKKAIERAKLTEASAGNLAKCEALLLAMQDAATANSPAKLRHLYCEFQEHIFNMYNFNQDNQSYGISLGTLCIQGVFQPVYKNDYWGRESFIERLEKIAGLRKSRKKYGRKVRMYAQILLDNMDSYFPTVAKFKEYNEQLAKEKQQKEAKEKVDVVGTFQTKPLYHIYQNSKGTTTQDRATSVQAFFKMLTIINNMINSYIDFDFVNSDNTPPQIDEEGEVILTDEELIQKGSDRLIGAVSIDKATGDGITGADMLSADDTHSELCDEWGLDDLNKEETVEEAASKFSTPKKPRPNFGKITTSTTLHKARGVSTYKHARKPKISSTQKERCIAQQTQSTRKVRSVTPTQKVKLDITPVQFFVPQTYCITPEALKAIAEEKEYLRTNGNLLNEQQQAANREYRVFTGELTQKRKVELQKVLPNLDKIESDYKLGLETLKHNLSLVPNDKVLRFFVEEQWKEKYKDNPEKFELAYLLVNVMVGQPHSNAQARKNTIPDNKIRFDYVRGFDLNAKDENGNYPRELFYVNGKTHYFFLDKEGNKIHVPFALLLLYTWITYDEQTIVKLESEVFQGKQQYNDTYFDISDYKTMPTAGNMVAIYNMIAHNEPKVHLYSKGEYVKKGMFIDRTLLKAYKWDDRLIGVLYKDVNTGGKAKRHLKGEKQADGTIKYTIPSRKKDKGGNTIEVPVFYENDARTAYVKVFDTVMLAHIITHLRTPFETVENTFENYNKIVTPYNDEKMLYSQTLQNVKLAVASRYGISHTDTKAIDKKFFGLVLQYTHIVHERALRLYNLSETKGRAFDFDFTSAAFDLNKRLLFTDKRSDYQIIFDKVILGQIIMSLQKIKPNDYTTYQRYQYVMAQYNGEVHSHTVQNVKRAIATAYEIEPNDTVQIDEFFNMLYLENEALATQHATKFYNSQLNKPA